MILKRLSEYAERIDLPPAMYFSTPIRWLIDLDLDGNMRGWVSLQGDGKRGERGKDMLAPGLTRTVAVVPKLLADNGEYVLGIAREPEKAARVEQARRAFTELTAACAERTGAPEVRAVARFLDRWRPETEASSLHADFDPADVITFRIGEQLPMALPAVRDFWAEYTSDSDGARMMQCLICGEDRPVLERQPLTIKGIPGGQPSGTALISANNNAFESHGLAASLIAPTCRPCAERFGKAVNSLLADRTTSLRIPPVAFLFWTRKAEPIDLNSFLSQPDAGEVEKLLNSPRSGREPGALEEADFFCTTLSASGGRAVVRDYLETTVPRVWENLARWFRLQQLVATDGAEGRPLSIYTLAASLYRDANRDMTAGVPQALLRCALAGGRLPESLILQATRRSIAEQAVTRPRAALIKAVLLSNQPPETENTMVQLEPGNPSRAYHCGRLLAELEEVQRRAIPGAKATIIDRYFGTASSAPASAFGNLLRGAQAHLGKLRKEQTGAYIGLQQRLEEILSHLDEFPRSLGLREQALFSLGYYHQKAADRAAAREARESREAKDRSNQTTETPTEETI